ncbi:hypothetical protein AB8E32_07025 [Marinomonas polaris]|uniref:hypothetical protein n=1 Tax=Marinomonas polaris TaxID=293552 RepID=UPI003518A6EC
MSKNLEEFLRDTCGIENWHPTAQQLAAIEKDINEAIRSGKTLSRTECQHIVAKHCGSVRMLMLKSADNSDLNTLLALAIKKGTTK